MRYARTSRYLTYACAAALLAGCADGEFVGPNGPAGPSGPLFAQTVTVCEAIDFNQFAHGDTVETVSALGMTLTVQANLWLAAFRSNLQSWARAYDTDKVGGPDPDLEWNGAGARCPDCQGLGRVLVLGSAHGFGTAGDDNFGGTITFTGFTEEVFVQSWKALDNEGPGPGGEEPFLLEIHDGSDWVVVSQSSGQGDGSVETVASPQTLFDTSMRFTLGRADTLKTGSGAIDDIVLCRVEQVPGGDGCTIGYWKTHSSVAPGNQQDAWIPTGYTVSTLVSSVFNVPASLQDLNGNGQPDALIEALNYDGGPGVAGGARILLRQAVGALLNASHPDVSYELSAAQVISAVNSALASGTRNTMVALSENLDTLNNAGCTLN